MNKQQQSVHHFPRLSFWYVGNSKHVFPPDEHRFDLVFLCFFLCGGINGGIHAYTGVSNSLFLFEGKVCVQRGVNIHRMGMDYDCSVLILAIDTSYQALILSKLLIQYVT